ncbi:hypothetical protein QFC22_002208 [Naganishia vaughanmartiniae]|uniref:Uncharacterized protein n=1 Tax=Naganishia vaughanmartiniae TaxID=1424756 RepID=A0ACC2XDY8_9TREE|nr:hypothetical protein QFC22_002208 [Naganishia vaughanmartiniae]
MPKAHKSKLNAKVKVIDVPQVKKKVGKELGVPNLKASQKALAVQHAKANRNARAGPSRQQQPISMTALASIASKQEVPDLPFITADTFISADPLDAALTIRDSSVRAFARELKKVIDRSDVIIQVLDARDPEGTRSKWVEDEVRKREADGKRLIGIVNKIDLVPRSNLEAWLKHLRLSFPVLPFKSSTQSQRSNLSQAHVPTASGTGDASIPSTAASMGAPSLLRLLKQYALSRPHQTLTVGIIGYPNVGKSSLINSLKRSRACAVAAQPGKTRIIQEVMLDKGVKVLDCPGVVLEDFGAHQEGEEERRRRLGEVMLRNCIKVEEIEDPIAPVEAILSRVEMSVMQGLYPGLQNYRNVTEFLVQIALTTGRLKGQGIPNLEAAAVMVLRHWNDGKIPFYTTAPLTTTTAVNTGSNGVAVESTGAGMQVDDSVNSGDAILHGFSAAFDLDGLLANFGGSGEYDKEEDAALLAKEAESAAHAQAIPIDTDSLEEPAVASGIARPAVIQMPKFTLPKSYPALPPSASEPLTSNQFSRLFTQAELELLPNSHPLDRKTLKKAAKRSAKAAREAEIREREADEDMFDAASMFGSMSVAVPKRPEKKKAKAKPTQAKTTRGTLPPVTIDAETQKELEFANFLNSVGEQLQPSLSDRLMPSDSMEVETTADEAFERQTDLDGALAAPSSVADAAVLPDVELEESIAEVSRTNLESRIAKNRLYTRDETAPDAPETRVLSRVLEAVDLEFLDGREAKIAISLLAKTGFDPYPPNRDDPLDLRAAKPVPRRLLPLPEAEVVSDPANSDEKKTRPAKSTGLDPTDLLFDRKRDLVPVKKTNDEDLPEGLREGARLDIRYAMESDVKARTAAKDSQWYKKHGRAAGKGANAAREQRHSPHGRRRSASPGSRNNNGQSGDRRERGGSGRRPVRTQNDLDAELDAMRSGTYVEPATDVTMDTTDEPNRERRQGGRGGGGRREGGNRREQRSQEDLDAELEAFLADRGERVESRKITVDKSNRFE